MKERPILFQAPMVRAILDGRKSQTRRLVKPHPEAGTVTWGYTAGQGLGFVSFGGGKRINCPYGEPGGRLWVREAWHSPERGIVAYRADPPMIEEPGFIKLHIRGPVKWRPSIHMPRWASRITLEIASIQVERLQRISEADAVAEGVGSVAEYAALWDSINGKKPGASWAENPLVWVVEFKVAEVNS